MEKINTGKYENLLKRRRLEPQSLPIRPQKKKTRLYIDNEYLKGGYSAKFPKYVTMVYLVLAMHANYQYQTCFPSIATLMKYAGTKNRNSISYAIKILEAFNIIYAEHSKGRISNSYILLRQEVWRPIDSLSIDAIKNRGGKTVSISTGQAYQKDVLNGIEDDTRSHIKESYKRIQDV